MTASAYKIEGSMFPELIDALTTHIKNNIPKDSLRLDTIRAGYSNDEFEAAYATAYTQLQAATPVVPTVGYGNTLVAPDVVSTTPPVSLQPVPLTPPVQEVVVPTVVVPSVVPMVREVVVPTTTTVQPVPPYVAPAQPLTVPVPPPLVPSPIYPGGMPTVVHPTTTLAPVSPTVSPSPRPVMVAPLGSSALYAPEPTTAPVSHLKQRLVVGVVIASVVVVLGGGIAAAMTGRIPLPAFVAGLLGGAPYSSTTPLQDIAKGVASISSADFTVAFKAEAAPLDSDVYLMPEQIKKEVGDPAMLLGLLPKDFKANASISGQFDTAASLPDTATQITGSYETPDFSAFVDVEAILSQEKGAYIKVNRMPSLFMFDLSAIRGTWVHIIEEPLKDMAKTIVNEDVADKEKRIEQLKMLLASADEHQALTVVGDPVREKLGEDSVYKYTFILNPTTLKAFFTDTITTFDAKFGKGEHFLSEVTPEQIDLISSAAFVQYANTHTQYHVWAGSDGIPRKLEIENRIAIDDDAKSSLFGSMPKPDDQKRATLKTIKYATSSFEYTTRSKSYQGFCVYEKKRLSYYEDWQISCADSSTAFALALKLDVGSYCADATGYIGYGSLATASSTTCTKESEPVIPPPPEAKAERQVHASFALALNNVNKPVTITIPEGAMGRDEAVKKVPALEFVKEMTKARESGVDASSKATLNSARAQAEIHYSTHNNSYVGYCASARELKDKGVSCYDSATAWVAFTTLSTRESYCVDSTGYSGLQSTVASTTVATNLSCGDN